MRTVLRAAAALTPEGILTDAQLEFDGDRLGYVGPRRESAAQVAVSVVELGDSVLMPGLVNGHTHSAMTLLRGVSDDHGFMPWLAAVQAREQHLTHADVAAGLRLAMLDMIASGTTAFADMYVWDAELLELVRAVGMRVNAAVAVNVPDRSMFPGVSARTGREELAAADALAAAYRQDPQVRVSYGPHAPYSVPEEFLGEMIARSRDTGVPMQIHVSESQAEVADLLARTGDTPADYLARLGLFEVPVLAAHCVHLTPRETARFTAEHCAISHNPVSNLKLGNGVAPLPDWLAQGVRVALGTDSVASNNSLDLFEEVKLATILHRGVRHDAAAITATEVLRVATAGGAAAIGFPETGQLVAGCLADVIALDLSETVPHDNLVSHLAFTASGRDVTHVWIGGRPVYQDRQFLTLDAVEVRRDAGAAAERLRLAAG